MTQKQKVILVVAGVAFVCIFVTLAISVLGVFLFQNMVNKNPLTAATPTNSRGEIGMPPYVGATPSTQGNKNDQYKLTVVSIAESKTIQGREPAKAGWKYVSIGVAIENTSNGIPHGDLLGTAAARLYTAEGFEYKAQEGRGVSNMLPSGFRALETWIFLAGEETHPSQVSMTTFPSLEDFFYGRNGLQIKSALIKNPQPLSYPVSDPSRVQLNKIATPITFQPSGSISVLSTKFSSPYKNNDKEGKVVKDLEVTVALKNESVGSENKYGWLAAVIGSDGEWNILDARNFFWNNQNVNDLGPKQTITKTVKTQVNASAGSFYLILADVGTESTAATRDRWVFELGQTPFTGILVPTPTIVPTPEPTIVPAKPSAPAIPPTPTPGKLR